MPTMCSNRLVARYPNIRRSVITGRDVTEMDSPTMTYADVLTKQMVEDWADDRGFSAADKIALHLEERFNLREVNVVSARDQGSFLLLQLSADCWTEPREFALLDDGSLAW